MKIFQSCVDNNKYWPPRYFSIKRNRQYQLLWFSLPQYYDNINMLPNSPRWWGWVSTAKQAPLYLCFTCITNSNS